LARPRKKFGGLATFLRGRWNRLALLDKFCWPTTGKQFKCIGFQSGQGVGCTVVKNMPPDDRKAQRDMWDVLNQDASLPRKQILSLRRRFREEMERKRKAGLKENTARDKLRV
jgi:hypothetical protein